MSKRLSARVSLAALAVGAAALVPAVASAQGYYYDRPGYDPRCEQYRDGRTGAGALTGWCGAQTLEAQALLTSQTTERPYSAFRTV